MEKRGGFRRRSNERAPPARLATHIVAALVVAAPALVLAAAAACNFIVGTNDFKVGADAGPPPCRTNKECLERPGVGANHICRRSDGACVDLLSAECTKIVGEYQNDNALIIGSVLSLDGQGKSFGTVAQNAIELAIDDFHATSNGLTPKPGTSQNRPLVLVARDDKSNGDTAVAAAKHLVDDVKVPYVIGASLSNVTLKIATEVTIPGGVMLMSPSSTSQDLTTLVDNGLVWRTTGSNVASGGALSILSPLVEQQVRADLGMAPTDKITVAVLNKGDTFGRGVARAVTESLTFNGAPATSPANTNFLVTVDYGLEASGGANYQAAINTVLQKKPHIIFLGTTDEFYANVMKPIEEGWSGSYRPYYLFSSAGFAQALWDFVKGSGALRTSLRRHILGGVFGSTGPTFDAFKNRYGAAVHDGTLPGNGAPGGYDALYLFAYDVVGLRDKAVTGANLATGMERLVPKGTTFAAGPPAIGNAFRVLGNTQDNIDYDGASGPCDYDLETGDARLDVQIWCIKDASNPGFVGSNSGYFVDTSSRLKTSDESPPSFASLKTACQF